MSNETAKKTRKPKAPKTPKAAKTPKPAKAPKAVKPAKVAKPKAAKKPKKENPKAGTMWERGRVPEHHDKVIKIIVEKPDGLRDKGQRRDCFNVIKDGMSYADYRKKSNAKLGEGLEPLTGRFLRQFIAKRWVKMVKAGE